MLGLALRQRNRFDGLASTRERASRAKRPWTSRPRLLQRHRADAVGSPLRFDVLTSAALVISAALPREAGVLGDHLSKQRRLGGVLHRRADAERRRSASFVHVVDQTGSLPATNGDTQAAGNTTVPPPTNSGAHTSAGTRASNCAERVATSATRVGVSAISRRNTESLVSGRACAGTRQRDARCSRHRANVARVRRRRRRGSRSC